MGLRDQMISMVDVMNWFGCIAPGLANAALSTPIVRTLMQRFAGITDKRPLPPYAHERFDTWFRRHVPAQAPTRGSVILWDDTYVRYNEPHIGKAAVSVLEAAGYEVRLVAGRKDSGRPSFSVGRLDRAKRLGQHNVSLLRKKSIDTPIIFLEPSDFSMFAQDYKELGIDGADDVAARCVLFEQFVENLLKREPDALTLRELHATIAVHTHCHAKALTDTGITRRVAALIPGSSVRELETGCCGMAGAFGMLSSKYDLSVAVAQPLVEQIEALPHGSRVVACGTSCRQQISHLTKAKPLHIAELLAECLTDSPDAK